jgi:hypothetical protein
MDSKDGTMDYDATMERGGGSYPRRSVTWASASITDADMVQAAFRIDPRPDPDARLEPNEDWRVGWGRGAGWETPNVGDWIEIRRRLRTGRRRYARSSIGRALIATNPHQKTYWFIIVGSRNEPYHHGGHSTRFDIALKDAEQFIRRFDLGHNRQWAILVLANNQTQVKRWAARLAAAEWKEPEMRDIYEIMGTSEARVLRDQAAAEVDRGTERAAALLAKAAFLESLPAEPQVEDGEPNVIYFEKVFDFGGTVYNYAAIQFQDAWYTSGPVAGDCPRVWSDLVKWIYTYRSGAIRDDVQIWHATGYEPL